MAKTAPEIERGDDGKFHHPCGESFQHAAWYTKHALKCDGTKPATEGRIAARQRETALVPVGGRPRKLLVDEKTERRRSQYRASKQRHRGNGDVDRTPPAATPPAIITAATDKAMEIVIAGLRAKRDAIVVHRVVDGKDELVVVCERCPKVQTIGIQEAMQVALQSFMRAHDEDHREGRL